MGFNPSGSPFLSPGFPRRSMPPTRILPHPPLLHGSSWTGEKSVAVWRQQDVQQMQTGRSPGAASLTHTQGMALLYTLHVMPPANPPVTASNICGWLRQALLSPLAESLPRWPPSRRHIYITFSLYTHTHARTNITWRLYVCCTTRNWVVMCVCGACNLSHCMNKCYTQEVNKKKNKKIKQTNGKKARTYVQTRLCLSQ